MKVILFFKNNYSYIQCIMGYSKSVSYCYPDILQFFLCHVNAFISHALRQQSVKT